MRHLRDIAPSAEVMAEFRDSLSSETKSREFHAKYPEFCDKTMIFFEEMAGFAVRAATRDDIKQLVESIRVHAEQLGHHDRRINDLDYRVKHLEQLVTHVKIAVDASSEIAKQNLQLSQSISARLDEMSSKTPVKTLAAIPAIAWPIIGVVALASVAALAGEMAGFIRWLGTIKIFGA